MCINWRHYVIYLQNMKFERLILCPGGAYTDTMHRFIHESWLHRLIGKYPKWAKKQQPIDFKCMIMLQIAFMQIMWYYLGKDYNDMHYGNCVLKIGPWGPELIWYLAAKYKMSNQQLAPAVYHHVNHDKWGWVVWGFRLNLAKLDFLRFLVQSNSVFQFWLIRWYKITIFLDFPFKVTFFACFGLKVDLK